jgi:hypothetical protein
MNHRYSNITLLEGAMYEIINLCAANVANTRPNKKTVFINLLNLRVMRELSNIYIYF